MKISCIGQFAQHPRMIMQRCGYGEMVNRQGQRSYTRLLRGVPYPRFHAYIDVLDDGFQINLHLDVSAHAGEYDGPVVEGETARITAMVEQFRR